LNRSQARVRRQSDVAVTAVTMLAGPQFAPAAQPVVVPDLLEAKAIVEWSTR